KDGAVVAHGRLSAKTSARAQPGPHPARWRGPTSPLQGEVIAHSAPDAPHVPILAANSSKFLATTSNVPFGSASPVAGPPSPGRPTWPVRRPCAAAAVRSALWAATIMHWLGLRLSASAEAR